MLKLSEFLVEDRREFLRDKFEKQIAAHLVRHRWVRDDHHGSSFDELVAMDPTPNKIYLQWLCMKLLTDEWRWEDGAAIGAALITYNRIKHTLPPAQRDINKLKVRDLRDIADAHAGAISKNEAKREMDAHLKAQTKLFYRGPECTITIPTSEEASKFLGRGTRWCTAAERGNYFSHYNSQGPLYVFVMADGKKFQLHIESHQFMDERDYDATAELKLHYSKAIAAFSKHLTPEQWGNILLDSRLSELFMSQLTPLVARGLNSRTKMRLLQSSHGLPTEVFNQIVASLTENEIIFALQNGEGRRSSKDLWKLLAPRVSPTSMATIVTHGEGYLASFQLALDTYPMFEQRVLPLIDTTLVINKSTADSAYASFMLPKIANRVSHTNLIFLAKNALSLLQHILKVRPLPDSVFAGVTIQQIKSLMMNNYDEKNHRVIERVVPLIPDNDLIQLLEDDPTFIKYFANHPTFKFPPRLIAQWKAEMNALKRDLEITLTPADHVVSVNRSGMAALREVYGEHVYKLGYSDTKASYMAVRGMWKFSEMDTLKIQFGIDIGTTLRTAFINAVGKALAPVKGKHVYVVFDESDRVQDIFRWLYITLNDVPALSRIVSDMYQYTNDQFSGKSGREIMDKTGVSIQEFGQITAKSVEMMTVGKGRR